jgi:hypothetical protein
VDVGKIEKGIFCRRMESPMENPMEIDTCTRNSVLCNFLMA